MQPRLWLVFSVKLAAPSRTVLPSLAALLPQETTNVVTSEVPQLLQGTGCLSVAALPLLQTPPSMTVLTNGTAKVTCEARTSAKTSIYWLRQYETATKAKIYEFLASCNPSGNTPYKKMKNSIIVFSDSTRYFLNLTNVKPEDSGFYFCMRVGSPQLIFGTATELKVVDVLPTPAPTSKKTIVKKKQCPFPSPKTQKGPRCGLITLSLLVAGILVLLVSLSVAIHFHCLRRKARIRFMKQFHK